MASSTQQSLSNVVLRPDDSSIYGGSNSGTDDSTRNLETTRLAVSLPSETIPPVEQVLAGEQSYNDFISADPQKYPPTVQVPLEGTDGMLGRSSKVYATDDIASIERLQSPESMGDPPAPNEINMANLTPRPEADKATQEDALNTTLHQVSQCLWSHLVKLIVRFSSAIYEHPCTI